MPASDEQLELISRIYRTVLDPGAWPEVMDQLASHTQTKATNVLVLDHLHPEVQVSAASAFLTPDLLDTYRREYSQFEVQAIAGLGSRPVRVWLEVRDLVDEATNPCALWLDREHGIGPRITARLNDSPAWTDVLTLNYPSRRAYPIPEEKEKASVFLPHLATAIHIARPFQILRARFRAVLAVLDRYHVGVAIVTGSGSAVVRNREADRIVDLREGLSVDARGRLTADRADVAAALKAAVAEAARTSAGSGQGGETSLTIPRQGGEDSFLVEVSPLHGGPELTERFQGALVLVIDPTHRSVVSTRSMEQLYGLTSAEGEVLGLLVQGHSTGELAEIRRTGVETVRAQVKSVLAKTRTRGRPDLVRLALTINPPIDAASARE